MLIFIYVYIYTYICIYVYIYTYIYIYLILYNSNNKEMIYRIDENKTNNHIDNLRWTSRSQNIQNTGKRSNNTCGFKGVTYNKQAKKYKAQIRIDGKTKFLGYFKTAKDASKAYEEAAKKYHGVFYHKHK